MSSYTSSYTVYQQGMNWLVKKDELHPVPILFDTKIEAKRLKAELDKETESLRNELAAAQQTIADYQEQSETLIQSGVAADNALELVNNELVTVQAELDAWQNGGLREYKAKRTEIAQLKADLESANAELASMNVDNTKLWKENELLRQQLSEPIIDDINKLDGNHIATIPLSFTTWHIEKDDSDCENEDVSFGDFLKQSLADDVTNMQHELDMQALHEYHKARKESDLYFIDYEDGTWYIVKKGETIADDYSHSVQDAITKCKTLVEYQDIVEHPVIHSDSYRQADEDNMNYNADIGDSLK